jgi:hypothetical protein
MTHLILHKVRGLPAFDIAEEIDIGDEKGWIIPTSGHRAYPYQAWPLNDLPINQFVPEPIPADWPDHYGDEPAPKSTGLNIFDYIKIPTPKVNLVRRRI